MSADALTQVLAIVGTATGVLALAISYRTYANARPKLKVSFRKFEHIYATPESKNLTLTPQLCISNCGDRSTTLNELEMEFTVNGKLYKQKKVIEIVYDNDDEPEPTPPSKISVNAHKTIDRYVFFEPIDVDGPQQKTIDCTFKLYHTHGKCVFKGTSTRWNSK